MHEVRVEAPVDRGHHGDGGDRQDPRALGIAERRADTSGSAATATAGALVRGLLRGEQRRPAAVGAGGVSGPGREGRGGARRER